jgi:hypothetical protein
MVALASLTLVSYEAAICGADLEAEKEAEHGDPKTLLPPFRLTDDLFVLRARATANQDQTYLSNMIGG